MFVLTTQNCPALIPVVNVRAGGRGAVRITVDGFGRRLIGLELLEPRRSPSPRPAAAAARPDPAPAMDPASTVSAQVEQGPEPAPGFGFGSTATLLARQEP